MTSLRKTRVAIASTAAGFVVYLPPTLPAQTTGGGAATAPIHNADNLVGDDHDWPAQPANRAVGERRRGDGNRTVTAYCRSRCRCRGTASLTSVANLQTAEQYSQTIAQQVIPVLRQEVLAAQGVHVNTISGTALRPRPTSILCSRP